MIRTIRCFSCGGHGAVSEYTLDGSDFLGAKECDKCSGSGFLFITPKDRIVLYPGGPFNGSWPGAYEKASPIEQEIITHE